MSTLRFTSAFCLTCYSRKKTKLTSFDIFFIYCALCNEFLNEDPTAEDYA